MFAERMAMDLYDRTRGSLLGLALGDALGLPFEGLCRERTAGLKPHRFHLLGRTGFVSDDTEQTALLAQALLEGGDDVDEVVRRFRRSLIRWFWRAPFGIGGATLRGCLKMSLGFRRSGVRSAGNGAAMRAGIIGVHAWDAPERRRALARQTALLTHSDPRAVEGAVFVAELSAACMYAHSANDRERLVARACRSVAHPELRSSVEHAVRLASDEVSVDVASRALGNSGFVVHSLGICTFCFIRFGDTPMRALQSAIAAGGDTDTHAAIVGGWVGALLGERALPRRLLAHLAQGPFGLDHLNALSTALTWKSRPPTWSWPHAMLRNLALFPVIIGHGFARLLRLV